MGVSGIKSSGHISFGISESFPYSSLIAIRILFCNSFKLSGAYAILLVVFLGLFKIISPPFLILLG